MITLRINAVVDGLAVRVSVRMQVRLQAICGHSSHECLSLLWLQISAHVVNIYTLWPITEDYWRRRTKLYDKIKQWKITTCQNDMRTLRYKIPGKCKCRVIKYRYCNTQPTNDSFVDTVLTDARQNIYEIVYIGAAIAAFYLIYIFRPLHGSSSEVSV